MSTGSALVVDDAPILGASPDIYKPLSGARSGFAGRRRPILILTYAILRIPTLPKTPYSVVVHCNTMARRVPACIQQPIDHQRGV
ncbi:MAG: hypothetical protein KDH16_20950, partial [Rhodocyclaceae bacterium]|nr:hypothetical protein [Rhodocyclaceae bacterium]